MIAVPVSHRHWFWEAFAAPILMSLHSKVVIRESQRILGSLGLCLSGSKLSHYFFQDP